MSSNIPNFARTQRLKPIFGGALSDDNICEAQGVRARFRVQNESGAFTSGPSRPAHQVLAGRSVSRTAGRAKFRIDDGRRALSLLGCSQARRHGKKKKAPRDRTWKGGITSQISFKGINQKWNHAKLLSGPVARSRRLILLTSQVLWVVGKVPEDPVGLFGRKWLCSLFGSRLEIPKRFHCFFCQAVPPNMEV